LVEKKHLTTNQGTPIGDNQNSLTAGPNGPTLLEDYNLIEKLAHLNRERIPERIVHARGAGAYGVFKVEYSMKPYTKAAFLQDVGKETPVFVRFSTIIHPAGSPETVRDPRGIAIKFYTEEGNFDFVCIHLPVFFIRDALKFPDLTHATKPAPDTNIQTPDRFWDFMTHTPEATHMLTWLFSDFGTPATYRHIDAFVVHAFKWVNADYKVTYVKYHWKTLQGLRNLSAEEARAIQGNDFNHATKDLIESIRSGDFPQWELYVQFLIDDPIESLDFDPLDPTKVWPENIMPLHKVGTMTLNRNPVNFFAEVEQSAFNPGAFVPGIQASEDKLLQGRLFAYADTQRYRLGSNYLQIPVNCPYAPVRNHQRDGFMQIKQNPSTVNYEPNHYENEPKEAPEYKEAFSSLNSQSTTRSKMSKTNDFAQAGMQYRKFSESEKDNLIKNLAANLKQVREQTKLIAVCNFFRADREYGMRLANELGLDISAFNDSSAV